MRAWRFPRRPIRRAGWRRRTWRPRLDDAREYDNTGPPEPGKRILVPPPVDSQRPAWQTPGPVESRRAREMPPRDKKPPCQEPARSAGPAVPGARRAVVSRRVDETTSLGQIFTDCLPAFGGAFLRRIYTILD